MLINVPRISDPAALVEVELVDRGCAAGTCASTFAFDGKVVAVPWRIPVGRAWSVDDRFRNDARMLRGHDLDLLNYSGTW